MCPVSPGRLFSFRLSTIKILEEKAAKQNKAEPGLEGQKLLEGLGAPELMPPEHAPGLVGKGRPEGKTRRRKQIQIDVKWILQLFTNEKWKLKIGEKLTWLGLFSLSLLSIPPLVWAARQSLLFLMPSSGCPSNSATRCRELHCYSYMQKALSLSSISSFASSNRRLATESNRGVAAPEDCQNTSGPDWDQSLLKCCKSEPRRQHQPSMLGRFHPPYVGKAPESADSIRPFI